MYDRILIATDASDHARRAAEQAVSLAKSTDASLHAVYVIETRTAYDNAIVDPETVRQNFRDEGEQALEEVAEMATAAGIEIVSEIREGVPSDEILAYADEHGVDLVAMGSKGGSEFKTVMLGSATEALLQAEAVPVLVVNGPSGGDERSDSLA